MRHAALLAFPSYGPESLSRVLIEAAALGVPIAAMDTGGTRDILARRNDGSALVRSGRLRAGSGAARRRRAAAGVARRPRRGPTSASVSPRRRWWSGWNRCTDRSLNRGRPSQHDEHAPSRRRRRARRHAAPRRRRAGALGARSRASSGRPRRRGHADHAAAACGAPRGGRRSVRVAEDPAAARAVSHVPAGEPPRHDDPRSQHVVSALRRARGAAGGAARAAGRGGHRPRVRRQRARLRSRAGARAAGRARRPPSQSGSMPLVFNPQGLEEFGATSADAAVC